jgi:adhesin HecA-like repeat protein
MPSKRKLKAVFNTTFKGGNIAQAGKVTPDGMFIGEAQTTFINTGDIFSGKGLSTKAGDTIENALGATLFNKEGEIKLEAPNVINKGKILSKEDLRIFASKLFLNDAGTVNSGRDATITADSVKNIAGRILVARLLAINAKKFENNRAPTKNDER